MWEESKHPRADDGRFTTKNGTPAEHKRLREKGIENDKKTKKQSIPDLPKRQEVKLTSVKVIDNYLKIDNNLLKNQIIEDGYGLDATGRECITLKNVLMELGCLNKPIVVENAEFDKLKQETKSYFRGVPKKNADIEYREDDDVWVGRGSLVNGIYFTTNRTEAIGYSESDNNESSLIEILIHPNAKIIDFEELNKLDNEERIDALMYGSEIESKYGKEKAEIYYNDKRNRCRKSIKAAIMGFDVIKTSFDHYVVLNRGVTIVRKGE